MLAPVELDAFGVVGALFRAEHAAVIANGAAMAAREAVQHASAVTAALDAARGELQRAAERERAARDEAERANRAKDEFLAMLGHELRNPLAPIVTALSLLKLRGLAGTPENEVIERQMGHLIRLVDDLLDVSRITRGLVRLERRPVELATVIAKAVEMASPLLERQRHRFSVSVASNGMMLDADEGRLAQVLSNLLTNAARYTPAGGDISLAAVNTDSVVEITVKDSGMGIDPEILPKIFDLFFQGKRSSDRAEGGLGLGLALARNLVAMHGGTIEARSAGRGRGSEFVVRLPALPAERRTDPAPVAPAHVERTGASRRVLVVDDNKDAAELLAEFLRMEGHDVAIAGDGAEALQMFGRSRARLRRPRHRAAGDGRLRARAGRAGAPSRPTHPAHRGHRLRAAERSGAVTRLGLRRALREAGRSRGARRGTRAGAAQRRTGEHARRSRAAGPTFVAVPRSRLSAPAVVSAEQDRGTRRQMPRPMTAQHACWRPLVAQLPRRRRGIAMGPAAAVAAASGGAQSRGQCFARRSVVSPSIRLGVERRRSLIRPASAW